MAASGGICALFALVGLAVGSFLNVCIDRLPAGRSIVRPSSACDGCHRQLSARDLVPVLSYIWLRGRCRFCGARIPFRVLAVELATGLGFALLYWHFLLTPQLGISLAYLALLTLLFVVDLEHQVILDVVVYPGMALALIFSLLYPGAAPFHPLEGLRLAAVGGLVGLALMFFVFLVSRGGMGLGDVKMAALVGLISGFPGVLVALLLAVLGGGLVAAGLLISGLKGRKAQIPFGPFLAAGAMAAFVWGPVFVGWYHHVFPF